MYKDRAVVCVFLMVAVVGLVVLSACQSIEAAASGEQFDYARAAEHAASRWQAMGSAYEKLSAPGDATGPDDIASLRWQAMAEAYQRLELSAAQSGSQDIMVQRWQAMADHYQKAGMLAGVAADSEPTAQNDSQ